MGSSLHLYEFLLLCCFHLIVLTNSSSSLQPLCHEDESSALLHFKHSLFINESASYDPSAYAKVESWRLEGKSSDCCSWDGVKCDQDTGHVIGLDLGSSFLYGSINSSNSLFKLVHLRSLNLADNDFNYFEIPPSIGNLSRLTSLNLSYSSFFGQIPSNITNLSKLAFLDLGGYFLKLEKPSLKGLVQNLTNLEVLNLSDVNISSTLIGALSNLSSLTTLCLENTLIYGEFPSNIFRFPNLQIISVGFNDHLTGYLPEFPRGSSLKQLATRRTSFSGMIPVSIGNLESLSILKLGGSFFGMLPDSLGNLAYLTTLDLSHNNFSGKIPTSLANLSQLALLALEANNFDAGNLPFPIGKLSKLTELWLRGMKIGGEIPQSMANLTQLSILLIGSNEFVGQIPFWLMNLTQLTVLDLSYNQLHGKIPNSISHLKHLEKLYLFENNLSGKVELEIFLSLHNLTSLQLSYNKLTVLTKNSTNATLPKFNILGLDSCNLREFPDFLRFQDELAVLSFADNKIRGQIPTWLWNTSKETMLDVDFSNNFLNGFELHLDVIPWRSLQILNLKFNELQGSLPIPPPSIISYKVATNFLTGEIPPSICHSSSPRFFDLSDNYLSGTIPQCLASSWDSLLVLNLSSNNFHGTIPQAFMRGIKLKMIDLGQNHLHGQVPRSFTNCTMLEILVLGNNQIEDTFPFWLGVLSELQVLVLRSNRFYGAIENPKSILNFPKLRIIDLSHNGFSSNLPSNYFQNWNSMKMVETKKLTYMHANSSNLHFGMTYTYSITMANKGTQRLYEKIQNAFVAVDFSNNKFSGEIPESLGCLNGLQMLNLSDNNFTGVIPSSLANLTNLESLDLSQNLLSGEIPQQLSQLTFLEFLNLSHNRLIGPIPHGKQFDTFENNSYDGNSGLCGFPLSNLCGNSKASPPLLSFHGDDSKFPSGIVDWIVILMGYGSGLIVGLVIGHTLTTRYHQWFIGIFGRRKQTQRRVKKKGRRN